MTTAAQIEAIKTADAYLNNAGLPTFTQLAAMLDEARRLGLSFDIGSAYIRRSYIDHQTELTKRIHPVVVAAKAAELA